MRLMAQELNNTSPKTKLHFILQGNESFSPTMAALHCSVNCDQLAIGEAPLPEPSANVVTALQIQRCSRPSAYLHICILQTYGRRFMILHTYSGKNLGDCKPSILGAGVCRPSIYEILANIVYFCRRNAPAINNVLNQWQHYTVWPK